ncbi:MAG: hypothetical protein A2X86_01745 [Bdellovibrionales bacterium GWA2_49_15]|nr:MAG: hypothetical protein A2X86_01745 [Bdellovibrionales bacterium GWA2_49_15]
MNDVWATWQQASCMPDHCFCEGIHFGDLIRQPSNTWSNLSFIFFAAVIAVQARRLREGENPLTRIKTLPYLYAASCLLVGLGSFFFHASLTFVGQWVDVLGMYLAVTFFTLYNFYRIYQWKLQTFVILFFCTNASLGYVLYAQAWSRRYLFGLFVLILLASILYAARKIKASFNHRYLYQAIASFLAGVTIWVLDLTKVLCDPAFALQGHALWHFLAGLSTYLIYKYYSSQSA